MEAGRSVRVSRVSSDFHTPLIGSGSACQNGLGESVSNEHKGLLME